MSADASPAGARRMARFRWPPDAAVAGDDLVVDEAAIALSYNGLGHAVMMATPNDLEDFALGFSLHEGIVAAPEELRFLEVVHRAPGFVLELAIPQHRFDALALRQRRTLGSSACGLCGSEALAGAMRVPAMVSAAAAIDLGQIAAALRELPAWQRLNAATGGAHAAAWCDANGVRVVREDVGRHCAFDKLVGALRRAGQDPAAGFAVVSSRASYELVHKAATSGIAVLVAISAPTSAAIDVARRCGIRLIAFARDATMNVYTTW
jgi:formate dehydrogenase accessory protein FdhD